MDELHQLIFFVPNESSSSDKKAVQNVKFSLPFAKFSQIHTANKLIFNNLQNHLLMTKKEKRRKSPLHPPKEEKIKKQPTNTCACMCKEGDNQNFLSNEAVFSIVLNGIYLANNI